MDMTFKQVCDAAGIDEFTGWLYRKRFPKYFAACEVVPMVDEVTDLAQQRDFEDTIRRIFQESISQRNEAILQLEKKVDALISEAETRNQLLMENVRLLQQPNRPWWKFFGKK